MQVLRNGECGKGWSKGWGKGWGLCTLPHLLLLRAFTSSCMIPSFVLTSLTSCRMVPRRRVLVASSNKKWSCFCFFFPALNELDEMTSAAYPMTSLRTVPGGTPSASNRRLPAATPLSLVAMDTTVDTLRTNFLASFIRTITAVLPPLLPRCYTRDTSYEYVPFPPNVTHRNLVFLKQSFHPV